MPNYVEAASGSGGPKFRSLGDGTEYWPSTVVSYVVSGSTDNWVLQEVNPTHGLPVTLVSPVTLPISAVALPLPTGAATAANQTTELASLASIDGKITACNTGSVVIASSALPTGGATAALQTTSNASLSSIDGKLTTGNTSLVSIDGKITACNTGAVVVSTLPATPAGTNLVGRVSSSDETSTIYNGTTALTPKFAKISGAASGDNTLIAAVTSKKIRVISLALINAGTAVSAYFKSSGGTAVFADSTNKIPLDKTGVAGPSGLVLGHNTQGWMETAAGEGLVLNLSAAQGVCGGLTYVEV